jgi:hypothetical protein
MAAKKRIGRPPKAKEDRKAVNFTFRSRGQMRERLQTAAMASGCSISEEIERRLEESFRTEDLYGGPHISAVFRILANHIALARAKAGGNWAENDQVRNEIAQVFADLLAKNLPQFFCVAIQTVDQHGKIRGVSAYAKQESQKRMRQGIAEMLRQARETLPPSSAHLEREDLK